MYVESIKYINETKWICETLTNDVPKRCHTNNSLNCNKIRVVGLGSVFVVVVWSHDIQVTWKVNVFVLLFSWMSPYNNFTEKINDLMTFTKKIHIWKNVWRFPQGILWFCLVNKYALRKCWKTRMYMFNKTISQCV